MPKQIIFDERRNQAPAFIQTKLSYNAFNWFANNNISYSPLKNNIEVYRLMRAEIPYCNIAIKKITLLISTPEIKMANDADQRIIDEFMENVPVNGTGIGYGNCLTQSIDAALETGYSFYETVISSTYDDILYLRTASPYDLRWLYDPKQEKIVLGTVLKEGFTEVNFRNPDLISYIAFDQRPHTPEGFSMLYSCAYHAQLYMKAMKAMENATDRVADMTLLGLFPAISEMEDEGKGVSIEDAKSLATLFKEAIKTWMQERRQGKPSDISLVVPKDGGTEIRTLFKDAKLPQISNNIRTILEAIIANTGLHPAVFGLSWSARESQAASQNDILQSNIKSYRELLNPNIRKTVKTKMILAGRPNAEFKIDWPDVMQSDNVNEALAKKHDADAFKATMETIIYSIQNGAQTEEQANQFLEERGYPAMQLKKGWATEAKNIKFFDHIVSELGRLKLAS